MGRADRRGVRRLSAVSPVPKLPCVHAGARIVAGIAWATPTGGKALFKPWFKPSFKSRIARPVLHPALIRDCSGFVRAFERVGHGSDHRHIHRLLNSRSCALYRAWMVMLHATAFLPKRRGEHDASLEGRDRATTHRPAFSDSCACLHHALVFITRPTSPSCAPSHDPSRDGRSMRARMRLDAPRLPRAPSRDRLSHSR